MADITTTDAAVMCHADESTIPETVEVPTVHFIKGSVAGTQITVGTLTVSVADWSGGTTATKTITGLTADDDIVLFPADADLENEFGVSYTQDGADLDFTATSTPDEDIVYTKYHIYKGVNA